MNKWTAHQKNEKDSEVNLICFPYAGGSASYFASWTKKIPGYFGLIPILYPMREKRMTEDMPKTIDELAEIIADEGKELFEKPFIIYSHCTGSLVAYETVRLLKEKYNISPVLFVTSSEPSPRKTLINPDVDKMSKNEFIEYVIELGLLEKSMVENDDFMNYYFPVFTGDFLMHQRYKPNADLYKMDCPIIAFRGKDDMLSNDDIIKDWENYTDDFTFYKFEGDHFFINQQNLEMINIIEEKYRSIVK